jgi:type IV secretory pathway VirB2 component (pilin)
LSSGFQYTFLPFLRRFDPALPFPLFFVFCTLVWKSLVGDRRSALAWATGAGLTLGLLIFSYFFLWTSALAWLACLIVLWSVARPKQLKLHVGTFATVALVTLAALVPYLILLSRRSATMDKGQKLTLTHAPDLFRVPELLGFAVIAVIVLSALRGRINWRAPQSLFIASFALMPFLVFNQQIVTGYSLQPFHYESCIANYVALVGAIVLGVVLWRGPEGQRRTIRYRVAGRLVVIAICWAFIEVLAPTKVFVRDSQFIDRGAAVGNRLRQLSTSDGPLTATNNSRPLVLASDSKLSLMLPTFAPLSLLWSPNFDFLNIDPGESRERFYMHLYYTGMDGARLTTALGQPMNVFAAAAFGHERVIPDLAVQPTPISREEIAREVASFEAYVAAFDRERANHHPLSYVIVATGDQNLSNLDRWYSRDQGEQIGDYMLYRVQLRP